MPANASTGEVGTAEDNTASSSLWLVLSVAPTLAALLRGDLQAQTSCLSPAFASPWRVYGWRPHGRVSLGLWLRRRPEPHKGPFRPRVAPFMNAECSLVEFPIVPRPPSLRLAHGNDATVSCVKDDINMQIDAWPPVMCLCVALVLIVVA